ncbi:hypothetical protein C0J52_22865 [Blattella germanica]|nr:hypothetical protein C0J52_22865 [Blattella germanica]
MESRSVLLFKTIKSGSVKLNEFEHLEVASTAVCCTLSGPRSLEESLLTMRDKNSHDVTLSTKRKRDGLYYPIWIVGACIVLHSLSALLEQSLTISQQKSSTPDFFLWDYLKCLVCNTLPRTNGELKKRIVDEIADILPKLLGDFARLN